MKHRILKKVLPNSIYLKIRRIFLLQTNNPTALNNPIETELDTNAYVSLDTIDYRPCLYIVSPIQRSGTNYLYSILKLHEDIYTVNDPSYPKEEFLYFYAPMLVNYSAKTFSIWRKWNVSSEYLNNLNHLIYNLGNGILNYLFGDEVVGKMPMMKTPDAHNIKYLPHLLPNAKMIFLLRDGRDTVQSFINSWGGESIFKTITKRWTNRMLQLNDLVDELDKDNLSSKYLVTRYESLLQNPKNEVTKILNYLELDPKKFDWAKLENLPVLGSSFYRKEEEEVHWKPLKKTDSFTPTNKWKDWSKRKKRVFGRISRTLSNRKLN